MLLLSPIHTANLQLPVERLLADERYRLFLASGLTAQMKATIWMDCQ